MFLRFFAQARYCNLIILTIVFCLFLSPSVKTAPLEEIETRGNLIVGVKNNLPPLGFKDDQDNWQGLEIDIARRIAQELFNDEEALTLIPVLNQNRLPILMEDKVDLVIASVTVNSSRRRLVDFSEYYFMSTTAVIVPKSFTPLNFANIPQKIGVLQNSRSIDELKYNAPSINLLPLSSYQQALDLINKGEIEGFAGDITVLQGWVQEYPEYKILSDVWGGYPLAIALPKGRQYQSLRDRVNQIVKKLKTEGWLQERVQYWGLDYYSRERFD